MLNLSLKQIGYRKDVKANSIWRTKFGNKRRKMRKHRGGADNALMRRKRT